MILFATSAIIPTFVSRPHSFPNEISHAAGIPSDARELRSRISLGKLRNELGDAGILGAKSEPAIIFSTDA